MREEELSVYQFQVAKMKKKGQIYILSIFFLVSTCILILTFLPSIQYEKPSPGRTKSILSMLDYLTRDTAAGISISLFDNFYKTKSLEVQSVSINDVKKDILNNLTMFKLVLGEQFNYKVSFLSLKIKGEWEEDSIPYINEINLTIEYNVADPLSGNFTYRSNYTLKVEDYTRIIPSNSEYIAYDEYMFALIPIKFTVKRNFKPLDTIYLTCYLYNLTSKELKFINGVYLHNITGYYTYYAKIPPEYMLLDPNDFAIIIVIRDNYGETVWFYVLIEKIEE